MKIDHIGIAVKSLAEAVKLYENAMGLKVSGYDQVDDQGVRVAMLAIGESREFNEICGHLRERIEKGHYRGRERRFEANMAPQELVG